MGAVRGAANYGISKMAASSRDVLFDVSVRDSSGRTQIIPVRASTSVSDIKRIFSQKAGVPLNSYQLVFAGRQLSDADTLQTLGVQSHSTLFCIRGGGGVKVEAVPDIHVRAVEDKLGTMTTDDIAAPPSANNRFYVYCKSVCKEMKPGKLRVRCASCKDDGFTLTTEPQGWSDVLEKLKLRGRCHNDKCGGDKFAEFYFKCAGHSGRAGVRDDECVALHMIRTNTVHIECPLCADEKDIMVVFTCDGKDGHCLCLDCFKEYSRLALTERRFIENAQSGYSIQCPNKCPDSFVTEVHHFCLLGDDLYERYKKFGTEEWLLQMGGVLCPQPGCGEGMLPEDPGNRVTCPTCRHTFCRNCKNPFHRGNCDAAPPTQIMTGTGQQIDGERLRRSRWDEASEAFIRSNATIKPCPRCHVNIEKNGGCMHMTCSKCRFNFCWICLIEWGRRCQDNHWFGERN